MNIQYLMNKNEKDWNEFINGPNCAGVWHTLDWKKIIEEEYGYKPYYLMAEENGEICGVLPLFQIKSKITGNRIVSLPFSYDCGPVATSEKSFISLINEAKKLASDLDCNYLEIKIKNELPEAAIKNTQLIESKYYFTSVLKLSNDPTENWKKLDTRRTRWAIKKAIKSGVNIRTDTEENDLEIFHDLKVRTRRKHGSPTPSLSFFKKIMKSFQDKGIARLWVAELDKKIISGLIFYTFKDLTMPAYIASDDRYNSYMPSNLLYWKVIEWGCNNNYHYFDFGRTEPNNEGLLNFKTKWGTDNFKIPYYYYPEKPQLISMNRSNLKVKLITSIWKKMPLLPLKIIGPHLLKHIG